MTLWVADFETTSVIRKRIDNTSHVWAVGLCEVGNPTNTTILKTINEFFEWCEARPTNDTVYFHNMRFDGNFIVQNLLKQGYEWAKTPMDKKSRTFTTIISDTSLWYQIEIYFKINGRNVKKVTILDSLKLIPLRVKDIAKSFKLPIVKGKIDYEAHDLLPEGSELTLEEQEYLKHDVQIVEHAINFFKEQGLTKMTIGANALEEFKKTIGKKNFDRYFPKAFYDADVRKAYKGGFTYLNPKFRNKVIKYLKSKKMINSKGEQLMAAMIVLDVNSLYPSVMRGCNGEIVPYGTPIFYKGEYEEDKSYPLYIQKIRCSFKIKPGKIPTIQIKHSMYYQGNQYLTSSDNDIVTLYLTSVDLKLFLDQYDVYNLEYCSGWKFKGIPAGELFGEFIDKWSEIKIQSKKEGNHGMYLLSKLMLNNLYGKFGTAIEVRAKEPYLSEDGNLRFKMTDYEEKDGVYIAMACFITAYARDKTIRAAQMIQDRYHAGLSKAEFVYADTDSLHIALNGEDPEEFLQTCGLDIHSTKLGAWDHEATASEAKFLRQKCYMEKHIISEKKYLEALANEDEIHECYIKENDNYYYVKITVAGMPDTCYKHVNFKNFKMGATYPGKLAHVTVQGGVVLESIDFTIKP